MKNQCLYDALVPVSELVLHPKNRNSHSDEQIERLAQILEYQGWRYPIKVSKQTGFITSGHGRLAAAKLNRWTEVPVNYQNYESEDQEYADLVADNSIASWSELDFSGINSDIKDLGPDFDIDLLGIKNFEIDKLSPLDGDKDEAPAFQRESAVKLGDIWTLGDHRLMCGDSTMLDQVERLMGGEKAHMVFTDPPYNIGYEGGALIREKIDNDDMDGQKFYDFLLTVYTNLFMVMQPGASLYVTHADTERVNFTKAFIEAGFHFSSVIIWNKSHPTFGRQDYFWKHEPMLYGWHSGGAHQWYGPNNETTVWDIARPTRSEEHPTMKPVELIERALTNSTRSRDCVLDLFGGSGSTLIACEAQGRRARLMELMPGYCAVTLSRWAKLTGQDPVRQDGVNWSDLRPSV